MIKTRTAHKIVLLSLISALALGACGIRGDLKTPPPLWGDKDKQSQPQKTEPQKQDSDN